MLVHHIRKQTFSNTVVVVFFQFQPFYHQHHDSNHHLQAVGEEKCTVFIEDRLYDDRDETAPPKDKRSRLSCFMSDGRSYTIPFADADYIKENFTSGLYESGKVSGLRSEDEASSSSISLIIIYSFSL